MSLSSITQSSKAQLAYDYLVKEDSGNIVHDLYNLASVAITKYIIHNYKKPPVVGAERIMEVYHLAIKAKKAETYLPQPFLVHIPTMATKLLNNFKDLQTYSSKEQILIGFIIRLSEINSKDFEETEKQVLAIREYLHLVFHKSFNTPITELLSTGTIEASRKSPRRHRLSPRRLTRSKSLSSKPRSNEQKKHREVTRDLIKCEVTKLKDIEITSDIIKGIAKELTDALLQSTA